MKLNFLSKKTLMFVISDHLLALEHNIWFIHWDRVRDRTIGEKRVIWYEKEKKMAIGPAILRYWTTIRMKLFLLAQGSSMPSPRTFGTRHGHPRPPRRALGASHHALLPVVLPSSYRSVDLTLNEASPSLTCLCYMWPYIMFVHLFRAYITIYS